MMEFGWERVASRPLFSASRRKLPFAERTHCLVAAVPSGTSRRDADWCDRDGRAPHFNGIVPVNSASIRAMLGAPNGSHSHDQLSLNSILILFTLPAIK